MLHSTLVNVNLTRLHIAKPDIVAFFDELQSPVLKLGDIRALLSQQRKFWRLAQSTSSADFIAFLMQYGKLRQVNLDFPQRTETLFIWGDAPVPALLMGLRRDAYFSHYTAMQLRGLTEQAPTTIYLSSERSAQAGMSVELAQRDIDEAFARPPRVSHNTAPYAGRNICLLNGAHTGHLGVVSERVSDEHGRDIDVRLTNLERTLIDIAVRPFYAGGINEVAKAFELARGEVLVNKLMTMLQKLAFAYPYHQAIGYYLQRADYKPTQLDLVRRIPAVHDFYLTHDMGSDRCYVPDWRLYVPAGF